MHSKNRLKPLMHYCCFSIWKLPLFSILVAPYQTRYLLPEQEAKGNHPDRDTDSKMTGTEVLTLLHLAKKRFKKNCLDLNWRAFYVPMTGLQEVR